MSKSASAGRRSRHRRIGLIGCGAIGRVVAHGAAGRLPHARLAVVADRLPERARSLAAALRPKPAAGTVAEAAACDLVVEAAGLAAVPEIARLVLKQRADLILLSVGALVAHPELPARFRARGCRLHFPSGAVGGLDVLKAAARGHVLQRVTLTTRKPPAGLAGAPHLVAKRIRLDRLTEPVTVFAGTARQAIAAFPANVNVAAAVSLAGLGPDRTRIRVIADPGICRNQHTLEAQGAFGRLTLSLENRPDPDNPRTSRLAALSALALLEEICRGDYRGT